ncbi:MULTISPECIES: molecular chaperone HtpG [Calditerrivibrio]|jgi:molecular chaperone HtpG|uniref:Chaperone protein HtpG n=1 Tax=Calditerrivibrio nitroreducens TaxID=477976 RepID=A0A2J6WJF7_9BACT|nr:MAG: molecular chaperone HtpG [Calditerrivibrio nitroreducens]
MEKFEFRAEVKELLNLVINSLYSHKEIFLRELISNASDAIDKARYLSLTNSELNLVGTDWKIKIVPDKDSMMLKIIDNGIGMNKEEAINNLGTIAKSGTKEFLETLKKAKETGDINLIGQFGVGFYSAFMVAGRIDVISKKIGEEKGIKWTSSADGSYEIDEVEREGFGTTVILHMKEDEKEFLDEWRIRQIVKKYSDYIEYPIVLESKKDGKVEEETLNSMQALWLKSRSEIKPEEYNEFYKHISHDFNDPLETIHYKAEGVNEFTALLFIPSKKPFDIYYKSAKIGPALYVKKVQIMDACDELIPAYLRFIKGVVDSSDLPLNVSREMLQNNRQVANINKNITKKVLDTLKGMKKNDPEKYKKFFDEFGNVLKEGIHTDFERREEIASLMIFNTLNHREKMIDLDTYIENFKDGQEEIYYIVGRSVEELINSPQLEYFKTKGIDVILFTGEFDEIIIGGLFEYKGKKLKSVTKGDIKIKDEDLKDLNEKEESYKPLLEKIKDELKEDLQDVKASARLTDSLCCLVMDENAMDESMRRLFESMGQEVPKSKKILELNLDHPVMKKLKDLYDIDPKSSKITEIANMIFDIALISDGEKPKDPSAFSRKIADLMMNTI